MRSLSTSRRGGAKEPISSGIGPLQNLWRSEASRGVARTLLLVAGLLDQTNVKMKDLARLLGPRTLQS